jgi:hypothetical protein
VNVSVCFYPVEILPTIYRYGYAAPFYNVNTGIRTIVFGTKNKREPSVALFPFCPMILILPFTVGENFGILIAWIVISLTTLPLAQWWARRRDVAAASARGAGQAMPAAPARALSTERDSEKEMEREEA